MKLPKIKKEKKQDKKLNKISNPEISSALESNFSERRKRKKNPSKE